MKTQDHSLHLEQSTVLTWVLGIACIQTQILTKFRSSSSKYSTRVLYSSLSVKSTVANTKFVSEGRYVYAGTSMDTG